MTNDPVVGAKRTDRPATGPTGSSRHGVRTPARRPATSPAKLSRRYPGRDRLDASVNQLRRAFANLAREALVAEDGAVAEQLAALVDQVVADIDRTTAAADRALQASERSQADVRRELAKLRTLANRTPGGRARILIDRQIATLEAMLVGSGTGS